MDTPLSTAAGAWQVVRLRSRIPTPALLVEDVQQEYVTRYGGRDETPLEPAYFEPPQGAFFVGYLEDRPVASGAWRRRRRRRRRAAAR